MLRTMPRPVPPLARLREVSSRKKRLEHPLEIGLRQAGAGVQHVQHQPLRRIVDTDRGAAAIEHGVVHQIAQRAPQQRRHAHQGQHCLAFDGHLAPHGLLIGLKGLQQGVHVHLRSGFVAAQAAHEVQCLGDHGLHLPQVGLEARARLVVVQQLGAQAHPRQGRLQVVRKRREHAGAFVDEGRQPPLHGVEGLRGLAHFRRAVFGQRRARQVFAQRLRRLRQHAQRPHQHDARPSSRHGIAQGGAQDEARVGIGRRHRNVRRKAGGLRQQCGSGHESAPAYRAPGAFPIWTSPQRESRATQDVVR